jgi:hypothetical protein
MDTHGAENGDDLEPAQPTMELYGFVWSADPNGAAAPQPEPGTESGPKPEPRPTQASERVRGPRQRRGERVLIAGVAVALISAGVVAVVWHANSQGGTGSDGLPLSSTVETITVPATPSTSGASSTATGPSSTASPGAKASSSPAESATASHSATAPQTGPTSAGNNPPTAGGSAPGGAITPSAVASAGSDTPPAGYGTTDLALGRSAGATSHTQNYVSTNITDGDVDSYWEGAENVFPQTVTVDLGSVQWVAKMTLSLPPISDWNSRTQTIGIYGSPSGTSPSQTLAAATGYTFNANNGTGDAVTFTFAPQKTRYLILQFTANGGWPAAQLSELSVYS